MAVAGAALVVAAGCVLCSAGLSALSTPASRERRGLVDTALFAPSPSSACSRWPPTTRFYSVSWIGERVSADTPRGVRASAGASPDFRDHAHRRSDIALTNDTALLEVRDRLLRFGRVEEHT